eukprot:936545-Pelagomonas_calceolata.AAC.1
MADTLALKEGMTITFAYEALSLQQYTSYHQHLAHCGRCCLLINDVLIGTTVYAVWLARWDAPFITWL